MAPAEMALDFNSNNFDDSIVASKAEMPLCSRIIPVFNVQGCCGGTLSFDCPVTARGRCAVPAGAALGRISCESSHQSKIHHLDRNTVRIDVDCEACVVLQ